MLRERFVIPGLGRSLRRVARAGFAAALLGLAAGCGSSKPPAGAGRADLSPGKPLPPQAEEAAAPAGTCARCAKRAGAGHRCGVSAWCEKCRREAAAEGHVCGISAFCPKCGREAALAGHACGETRFCAGCKSDVPLVHEHGAGEKKPWGSIK
jgi:membrane protease subunit (stomatin/prohibitin family)